MGRSFEAGTLVKCSTHPGGDTQQDCRAWDRTYSYNAWFPKPGSRFAVDHLVHACLSVVPQPLECTIAVNQILTQAQL